MLKRERLYLWHHDGEAPPETRELEAFGHCVARAVFTPTEVAELRAAVERVFEREPPDRRAGLLDAATASMFRYEMLSRCAASQRAMAHPRLLAILDPLLGCDSHAINSTAWRNPPGRVADPESCYWHIDGGPHVPRPAGVPWPARIPYPIFVVATHIYLQDCDVDDGPTSAVPTSHRSGQPPPFERRFEAELDYDGHASAVHVVRAGDVGFFVSDVWHRRRLPTERGRGRFFLQTNYGRRDIAQRLRPTDVANQVSAAARERAVTPRERTLIGLHPPSFYDG